MKGTYAYSLDRESFTGIFNSRKEAFEAAVRHAERLNNPVTEVYVGQRVAGDAQSNLHAWELIKSMRERAKSAAGDEANQYLAHVTAEQAQDLDGAIEAVITRWEQNHKLAPTFHRIEGVSEHPLPTVKQVQQGSSEDEVYDLGVSDYT